MEHILQIVVCVDDKAIEEGVMKSLSENLSRKIEEAMFTEYGSLSGVSKMITKEWLDEHKEELLDKTADALLEYLKRTKAVKEMVYDVKKEIEGLKRWLFIVVIFVEKFLKRDFIPFILKQIYLMSATTNE